MLTDLLSGQISLPSLVALVVALLVGITVHEFAHALAATWLGDPTPRYQGRLTLSPLAHLDPMGALMFVIAGFGWGKPVQYNPYWLRAAPRRGPAIVAAAGPASNFLLAACVAIPVRLLLLALGVSPLALFFSDSLEGLVYQLLFSFVFYNLTLGFFNLIPIFPLDGFTILRGLVPPEIGRMLDGMQPYGMFILLALVFLGGSVLNQIIYRPISLLLRLLIGV